MHCLGSCRCFIQQRRAGNVHLRKICHERLEVQQTLESTLGDLRLVGRVLGVPSRILDQVTQDHRRRDGVVVPHADIRASDRVLRSDRLQLCQHLDLRQRRWQVKGLLKTNLRWHRLLHQLVNARGINRCQHGLNVRLGKSVVSVLEDVVVH